jgi:hypothetical protein
MWDRWFSDVIFWALLIGGPLFLGLVMTGVL